MNKMMTTLKVGGRAALVAVVLGTSTLAVSSPVMAQPSFSFKFDLGGDYDTRSGKRYYKKCLSDRQIIRAIRDYGFRNVEIVKKFKNWKVEAIGRYRGDWFSLRVDACTGDVYNIKRVRYNNDDDYYDPKPGIGLQFKFGY